MAAIGYLGKPYLKVRGEISTELRVTSDEDLGPRLTDPTKILNCFLQGRESSGLDFDFHCQASSVKDGSLVLLPCAPHIRERPSLLFTQ